MIHWAQRKKVNNIFAFLDVSGNLGNNIFSEFLAAIAALYALMSVRLSVGPSVPPQRVSRSVPKLLNVKNGSSKFIGMLYSKT